MRAALSSRPLVRAAGSIHLRAHYSPLPTRRPGPRVGRARAGGRHARVPPTPSEASDAIEPIEHEARRQPEPSGSRRSTPPFPTTGRGDGDLAWTGYDAFPTARRSLASDEDGTAMTAVDVVEDPAGVLRTTDPVAKLLAQPAIAVVRQLEMMNLFIGYEQANRYRLLTPSGETVGYLAEEEEGLGSALVRQAAGTHRAMKATVMDVDGREVLRMRRPFSFINSRIFVEKLPEAEGEDPVVIGEAQQQWHPWRRKYNLFYRRPADDHPSAPKTETSPSPSTAIVPSSSSSGDHHFAQFASIDSGLWAWDFYSLSETGALLASINRNFTGFVREIFTDTGQMVVRFEAVDDGAQSSSEDKPSPDIEGQAASNQYDARTVQKDVDKFSEANRTDVVPRTLDDFSSLTLDQRAVILATAVSIDFDYFTRSRGGLFTPPLILGGYGGGGAPQPAPGTAGAGTEAGTAAGVGMMEGALGGDYDERTGERTDQGVMDESGSPPPEQGWSEAPIGEWGQGEGMDEGETLQDPWGSTRGSDGGGGGWFGGWGGGDSGGGGGGGDWGGGDWS